MSSVRIHQHDRTAWEGFLQTGRWLNVHCASLYDYLQAVIVHCYISDKWPHLQVSQQKEVVSWLPKWFVIKGQIITKKSRDRATYKFVHFIECNDKLLIVNFVNDPIGWAFVIARIIAVMSIALIQAYDVSGRENSQFWLQLVIISIFFSTVIQVAALLCTSLQMK